MLPMLLALLAATAPLLEAPGPDPAQLFPPGSVIEVDRLAELFDRPLDCDVMILVHLGGWGGVGLDRAPDFAPIVAGIRDEVRQRGLVPLVVRYRRGMRDNRLQRVRDLAQTFGFSSYDSQVLARDVESLARRQPRLILVMAGLSNGGGFIDETIRRLKPAGLRNTYGIEVGIPFWINVEDSPHVLRLDNNGRDPAATGDARLILGTLLRGIWRGLQAEIHDTGIRAAIAFHTPGHDYTWEGVKPEVIPFLNRFLPTP